MLSVFPYIFISWMILLLIDYDCIVHFGGLRYQRWRAMNTLVQQDHTIMVVSTDVCRTQPVMKMAANVMTWFLNALFAWALPESSSCWFLNHFLNKQSLVSESPTMLYILQCHFQHVWSGLGSRRTTFPWIPVEERLEGCGGGGRGVFG